MADRKSVVNLTSDEVALLQDAIWAIKRERNSADGLSTYDRYVVIHQAAMRKLSPYHTDIVGFRGRNAAHRGPVFLPWHREFLRRFEQDLQRVSGNQSLGLPYWKWDNDTLDPDSSKVWDVMGPIGQRADFFRVLSGPFPFDMDNFFDRSNWMIVDALGKPDGPLIRTGGWSLDPQIPRRTLPSADDISWANSFADYDSFPWSEASGLLDADSTSFRNALEGYIVNTQDGLRLGNGLHNRVHNWMQGSMGPGTSPNDPIFFLHHAYVDKLWADWEIIHPNAYLPNSDGPLGHNWSDALYPWNGVDAPEIITVRDATAPGSTVYIAET